VHLKKQERIVGCVHDWWTTSSVLGEDQYHVTNNGDVNSRKLNFGHMCDFDQLPVVCWNLDSEITKIPDNRPD